MKFSIKPNNINVILTMFLKKPKFSCNHSQENSKGKQIWFVNLIFFYKFAAVLSRL